MFKNFSKIKYKLLTAFFTGIFLLSLTNVYFYFLSLKVSDSFYQVSLKREMLEEIIHHVGEINSAVFLCLSSTESEKSAEFIKEFRLLADNLNKHLIDFESRGVKGITRGHWVATKKALLELILSSEQLTSGHFAMLLKEENSINLAQDEDFNPDAAATEDLVVVNEWALSRESYLNRFQAAVESIEAERIFISGEISEELSDVLKEKQRQAAVAFGVIFLAIAASAIIILSTLRGVNIGLDKLIELGRKVSTGNLGERIKINSRDEIGYLGKAFNEMLENIAQSQSALLEAKNHLKEANLNLENKIKERTAELENLKNNLEKTVEERTKKLEEKMDELEKFQELTVGRELRIIELKKETERLKDKIRERESKIKKS